MKSALLLLVLWAASASAAPESVLVYGDSIAVGGWPTLLGWQMDAKNGRTLFGDAPASRLLAVNVRTVWLAIGSNDYKQSKWSPAEFGAAYGDLLDALHDRHVYAQTPIRRAAEPPNELGATMEAYRKVILAACALRPWCTPVDGRYLVPVSMLADGVHPNSHGYLTYAINVRSVIPYQ